MARKQPYPSENYGTNLTTEHKNFLSSWRRCFIVHRPLLMKWQSNFQVGFIGSNEENREQIFRYCHRTTPIQNPALLPLLHAAERLAKT